MDNKMVLHPELDGKPSPSYKMLALAAVLALSGSTQIYTGDHLAGISTVAFGVIVVTYELRRKQEWTNGYYSCRESVVDQLPNASEGEYIDDLDELERVKRNTDS